MVQVFFARTPLYFCQEYLATHLAPDSPAPSAFKSELSAVRWTKSEWVFFVHPANEQIDAVGDSKANDGSNGIPSKVFPRGISKACQVGKFLAGPDGERCASPDEKPWATLFEAEGGKTVASGGENDRAAKMQRLV